MDECTGNTHPPLMSLDHFDGKDNPCIIYVSPVHEVSRLIHCVLYHIISYHVVPQHGDRKLETIAGMPLCRMSQNGSVAQLLNLPKRSKQCGTNDGKKQERKCRIYLRILIKANPPNAWHCFHAHKSSSRHRSFTTFLTNCLLKCLESVEIITFV